MSNHDDDRDLFRQAMSDVERLSDATEPPAAPKPEPVARFRRADEARALEQTLEAEIDAASLETGEELTFRRPGVSQAVLRKLRRGRYVVEAELDLHGMTVALAAQAVAEFLKASLASGKRCVRIVHGKGHRSGQRGPVLKRKVSLWLRRREEVLAFASAPPVDGGTGAIYVLLRAKRS